MSAWDALWQYGPILWALVMIPVLAWIVAGITIEFVRELTQREPRPEAQERASVTFLYPRGGDVWPLGSNVVPFDQEHGR
jgi:hypothetical protein